MSRTSIDANTTDASEHTRPMGVREVLDLKQAPATCPFCGPVHNYLEPGPDLVGVPTCRECGSPVTVRTPEHQAMERAAERAAARAIDLRLAEVLAAIADDPRPHYALGLVLKDKADLLREGKPLRK